MSKHSQEYRKQPEPLMEQIASFVGFFILLLVFKSFFVPLFVIPTGSMAETLCGAHATHTCPNCGYEYQIGFRPPTDPQPDTVECPNCRYRQKNTLLSLGRTMAPTVGDRITVLGWPYDLGLSWMQPQRWDVVVFRNPLDPEQNFIKRLIGLRGDKVELIGGDVFINDIIQAKPRHVQEQLWFPYYDHDHRPAKAAGPENRYYPHWRALSADSAWTGLDTRMPAFKGTDSPRAEVAFATFPDDLRLITDSDHPPVYGVVEDVYGYNPLFGREKAPPSKGTPQDLVTDTRLSCDVRLRAGQGYVELSSTKHDDRFMARLHADGRLELIHENAAGEQAVLAVHENVDTRRTNRIALGNVDYVVRVQLNGEIVLQSTPEQYSITPAAARALSARVRPADLRIAAENIDATCARLRVERDIFYKYWTFENGRKVPVRAGQGEPFQLRDDEYFVMGDNSPSSHDGRLWDHAGPHMRSARRDYRLGTVPADQMIGRAFFVYWPGFLPSPIGGWNIIPDIGHVRWIR